MDTFKEAVEKYREWKKDKLNDSRVTTKELRVLRERFVSERKAGNVGGRSIREKIANYREWKLKKYGSSRLTESEIAAVKKEGAPKDYKSLKEAVLAYKQWKTRKYGHDKLNKDELLKIKEEFYAKLPEQVRLREELKTIKEEVKRLKEGDAAPDAAAIADPNAVDAAAAAPADPAAIQADVQAVQTAVEQLATDAGLPQGGAGDLGADPNAGVPPVDGQTPETAPVVESREARIAAIRERLAARKKKLSENDEPNACDENANACDGAIEEPLDESKKLTEANYASAVGTDTVTAGLPHLANPDLSQDQQSGSDKNPPSQLDQPNAAITAKGYPKDSVATRWPTKTVTAGPDGITAKVKESESFAERYLQQKLSEEKLSFDAVKSAMARGLLG